MVSLTVLPDTTFVSLTDYLVPLWAPVGDLITGGQMKGADRGVSGEGVGGADPWKVRGAVYGRRREGKGCVECFFLYYYFSTSKKLAF